MYSRSVLAKKYLQYYLTASNGKGHGVHSPFVFDFIKNVLKDGREYPDYIRMEGLRRQLEKDRTILEIEDMGAGTALKGGTASQAGAALKSARRRSVAEIARRAAKPKKLGQLLFRIARYYQPQTIVELGSSLGLSTSYLAGGSPNAHVYTIEGARAVAEVAERNFQSLGLDNIRLTVGNFDAVLGPVLTRSGPVDLAFVDGNHRRDPTLRYFNALMDRVSSPAVLIFDDIHWSGDMEAAWASIRRDPRVYLTVDLFFIGLVFLREEFKVKQDFTIRF